MSVRPSLSFLFLCSLLLLSGCSFGEVAPKEEAAPLMTPEAQAARVSATILSRKVQKLRKEALYIRHREEGALLLEELLKSEEKIPNE